LIVEGKQVRGVEAVDRESGEAFKLRSPVVVNCAGGKVRELARRFHRDMPKLMEPVLLINLLLDIAPYGNLGVGVRAHGMQGVHFLLPLQGRTLAGTYHAAARESDTSMALDEHVGQFLESLNSAAPGLGVKREHVLRVFSGWLPAAREGDLKIGRRPVIVDHGASGGPAGFHSVSGIKWTTARPVLEGVVQRLFPDRAHCEEQWPHGRAPLENLPQLDFSDPSAVMIESPSGDLRGQVRALARTEAVLHLDDLILRRTDWGVNPTTGMAVAEPVSQMLGWDERRQEAELRRVREALEEAVPRPRAMAGEH
jgi:glycerol-3-phosphate dehydrogenase